MTVELEHKPIGQTIRRMLRVLGAMPAHVDDSDAVRRAARFVHDRMARSDVSVEWVEYDGCAPLVVAGTGPVLVVTYVDDADPFTANHAGRPPTFRASTVSGPGILRNAGTAAAAAAVIDSEHRENFTLVVETDRNSGSQALEQWLHSSAHRMRAAIWEASDLPLVAPVVIHSANGHLALRITATSSHQFTEAHFGGVVPDLGRHVACALAEIVTSDHEVMLDGFYDGIVQIEGDEFSVRADDATRTADWLHRVAEDDLDLPDSHLAMGAFLAPGVVIRSIQLDERRPYLPVRAEIEIDIHLVPGQDALAIGQQAIQYFQNKLPGASADILMARPPVVGRSNLAALREVFPHVLHSAPGPNPAGCIESFGIPTVGYAAVGRNPENSSGRITIEETINGARLIQALAIRMAGAH